MLTQQIGQMYALRTKMSTKLIETIKKLEKIVNYNIYES